MQIRVLRPGAEILSVYAAIVIYGVIRFSVCAICVYADFGEGAEAVGIDGGIVVVDQMQVAGGSIQGVAAHNGVAGEVDCTFQIDTTAITGRSVLGDTAAGHGHRRIGIEVDAAAILSRAASDLAAVHGDGALFGVDAAARRSAHAVADLSAVHGQLVGCIIIQVDGSAVFSLGIAVVEDCVLIDSYRCTAGDVNNAAVVTRLPPALRAAVHGNVHDCQLAHVCGVDHAAVICIAVNGCLFGYTFVVEAAFIRGSGGRGQSDGLCNSVDLHLTGAVIVSHQHLNLVCPAVGAAAIIQLIQARRLI